MPCEHRGTGEGPLLALVDAEIATTLRRIGLQRIFFGSDMDAGDNPSPRDHGKAVRQLPLADDELRTLADNVPHADAPRTLIYERAVNMGDGVGRSPVDAFQTWMTAMRPKP